MKELIEDLKAKIIAVLNLQDVGPTDIDPDEQLVGGRLGIDSIDVLELVIMLEKDYGITIDNKEVGAQVFASLSTMARFITDNSAEFPN
jgi:acyl carrier protein